MRNSAASIAFHVAEQFEWDALGVLVAGWEPEQDEKSFHDEPSHGAPSAA